MLVSIVTTTAKAAKKWRSNEKSPRVTLKATVKAKRMHVTNDSNSQLREGVHTRSSTNYFVTFEYESVDRNEYLVSGKDYGLISEKDIGNFTFQGTRFIEFNHKTLTD